MKAESINNQILVDFAETILDENHLLSIRTVSYTHLDVYKRQILVIVKFVQAFGFHILVYLMRISKYYLRMNYGII